MWPEANSKVVADPLIGITISRVQRSILYHSQQPEPTVSNWFSSGQTVPGNFEANIICPENPLQVDKEGPKVLEDSPREGKYLFSERNLAQNKHTNLSPFRMAEGADKVGLGKVQPVGSSMSRAREICAPSFYQI